MLFFGGDEMGIVIKPESSPDGQTRVDAGGITFFFDKETTHNEILEEVKRTIKKEMGLIDAEEAQAQANTSDVVKVIRTFNSGTDRGTGGN